MLRSFFVSWVTLFFSLSTNIAIANFNVDAAYAPDTNLDLTVSAIKSAKQSVLLNIYELSSPYITEALLDRIQAGVHVEILEEGQPVGGFSAASKGIEAQIVEAMQSAGGSDHFYVMGSYGGNRRFHFDHGKYAVIDGNQLLIGSENYSPSGNPSAGTIGNRGWEVFIHDAGIAQNYHSVFQNDSSTAFGDVRDIAGAASPRTFIENYQATNYAAATNSFVANSVQRISSPDSSLNGIVNLITHARRSIDIELMTFDSASWSGGNNPLVVALQSAARRGVTIRVLLNDESAFAHSNQDSQDARPKNQPTVDLLNQSGGSLSAKIANIKAMGVDYIHNKGMIVDGTITLISSINWDQNSIQENREAAVAISSSGLASFYGNLFERDWQSSGGQ